MNAGVGWRVKLYELDKQGNWKDRGTGHVTIKHVPAAEGPAIVVVSEDNGDLLLQSKVQVEESYEQQNDNIIMWRELDQAGQILEDLALSFQEANGCTSTWQAIQECRRNAGPQPEGVPAEAGVSAPALTLPPCKPENLAAIRNMVGNVHPNQRDGYATQILANEAQFLKDLLGLFSDCEALEDITNLNLLAQIMRNILFLNDAALLELVLSDDMFMQVAGCLEYDPELKVKAEYREFLGANAKMKQIVPMKDADLVGKIKQTFQIKYMKEYMLRPTLDDSGMTAVNSLQQFNATDICQRLFTDFEYLTAICNIIVSPEQDISSRHSSLQFLRELFMLSKGLPADKRAKWYDDMLENVKALPAIFLPLRTPMWTHKYRQASAEIILLITVVTPSILHDVILASPEIQLPPHVVHPTPNSSSSAVVTTSSTLPTTQLQANTASYTHISNNAHSNEQSILFVLVRRLVEESDTGVQEQVLDTLRLLLDPDRMEKKDKDRLLQLFYDFYLHWLITPFIEHSRHENSLSNIEASQPAPLPDPVEEKMPDEPAHPSQGKMAAAASRRHICEVLSQCVQCHSYRMKYFVMRHNLITRVLRLLHSKQRQLHLAAIKFVRSVIRVNDDFYHRHVVKHDLLRPAMLALKEHGSKDCMLTSQIVEMVDFIRTENIKSLVAYLVEKHSSSYQEITHVDTFERLQLRYSQNMETEDVRSKASAETSESSKRSEEQRRLAEVEKEEEYFNEDDTDEASHSKPNPNSNPLQLLAQYGDDDENDEGAAGANSSTGGEQSPSKKIRSHPHTHTPPAGHTFTDDIDGVRPMHLHDEGIFRVDEVWDTGTSIGPSHPPTPSRKRPLEPSHPNNITDTQTQSESLDAAGDDATHPLPLGPLRPKFESDEDHPTDIFFRAHRSPGRPPTTASDGGGNGTHSPSTPTPEPTPPEQSADATGETKVPTTGISFSLMKKRKK